MRGDTTVVVTWMDGRTETITGRAVRNADGMLHIVMGMHSGKPNRHIPLANVREYTTEEKR